jgi:hypothetical protein
MIWPQTGKILLLVISSNISTVQALISISYQTDTDPMSSSFISIKQRISAASESPDLGTSGSIHPRNRNGITHLVKEEVERAQRERQGEMYMTGGDPSQPGEEEIHGLTLAAGRARR